MQQCPNHPSILVIWFSTQVSWMILALSQIHLPDDVTLCTSSIMILVPKLPRFLLTVFTQSPNSPDTNILDLGFFRAIQSFNDDCPANEEDLIKSVEKTYAEYPYRKLNCVWLTLQSCLNMIIENDGGNDYKILHMGKESLERRGLLPGVLDVTPAASAWLNPTMDDDSSQDSNDLDDTAHIPTTTATPAVEVDGEAGENTTTDEITNTGV